MLLQGEPIFGLKESFPLHLVSWTPNTPQKFMLRESLKQAFHLLSERLFDFMRVAQFDMFKSISVVNCFFLEMKKVETVINEYEVCSINKDSFPISYLVIHILNFYLMAKGKSMALIEETPTNKTKKTKLPILTHIWLQKFCNCCYFEFKSNNIYTNLLIS